MSAAELVTAVVPAVLRSHIIEPMPPSTVYRVARAASRGGANPATLLGVAAARWPDRAAIIDDDGAVTYAELHAAAEVLATRLADRYRVGPGRAVGILCRNGRFFIEGFFAAAMVGADVVLLNTDFRADALSAALDAHRIATVVCDAEFDLAAPGVTALHPADVRAGTRRSHRAPAGRIIVLTSGTTGTPKGVPRTPSVLPVLGVGASIIGRTGLRTGARIVLAVPMFHAFGFAVLMLAAAVGGTVITRRRFDAEAALAQASLHRADVLAAVPVMLSRILDLPDRVRERNPIPALRVAISGGARLDPTLAIRFMDTFGDILYNGYGSSEVGLATFATPADLRAAPETVGTPLAGCPVRVLGDDDAPVAPGVLGRVFVGGDLTFDGYTGGGNKAVVERMTSTGDMGVLDEHGRLFIVGREDDMIVSGGENVYPRAVENALSRHPDVIDNAVFGVPDQEFGQRLAAFVVPRSAGAVDETTLREYLAHNVSRYERPRDIHFVDQIPRNPAGKVLRRELPL